MFPREISLLFLAALACLSCQASKPTPARVLPKAGSNMRFMPSIWASTSKSYDVKTRFLMYEDLVSNHLRIGMPEKSLTRLMGKPDFREFAYDNKGDKSLVLVYKLYRKYVGGDAYNPGKMPVLKLSLDSAGNLASVRTGKKMEWDAAFVNRE